MDRVAVILDAVAIGSMPMALTELAARLDAPLSSTQGLVNGLVAVGYLTEQDRRYTLGPAALALAIRAGHRPLETVRPDDLVALCEATGLRAATAIRVGESAIALDMTGPAGVGTIDYLATRHPRMPLSDVAVGRVLLAYMPEDERSNYVTAHTGGDPTAALALLDELDTIRRNGYYLGSSGPVFDNLVVVAAPIWERGNVAAAIALFGDNDQIADGDTALPSLLTDTIRDWSHRGQMTT
ncbi:IclR family transcriptional regulator [Nocardia sp. NPDC049149]|uniref:IclR family transcriptional regulator n=1 Tax=Nocardia sp. NPDC049149 TaxID=3364315 RepID=UPI003714D27D